MRYLPLTDADRRSMLSTIGAASIDALFADVPKPARLPGLLDLPRHKGEMEVAQSLAAMAGENRNCAQAACFLGAGAYRHHVPATVDHLIQRSEFLTAYTPYQPEISQGTLQYLFEFQTQVAMLTGLDVANASMYDGSTACAEAVLMARRVTRRDKVVLSGALHPHYVAVTRTMLAHSDATLVLAPSDPVKPEDLISLIDQETACVVVQNPDVFGRLVDLGPLAQAAHQAGVMVVAVVAEVISLGAVTPPGAMGADIVVGEGQSLGNGLNFGGPYLGLFATREKFLRQMPGRLAGETVDGAGRRGYVLTLSTREQHIRREKATSNICTNSGLCALAFCIHLSLLGEVGLHRLAALNHARAVRLAKLLADLRGVEVLNQTFFNEFTLRLSRPAAEVVEVLADENILCGVPASRLFPGPEDFESLLIVAATETNSEAELESYARELGRVLS